MVLWGGVAAALVLLVVGIVFLARDDDKPNASDQSLPQVTLSTTSSEVSVQTVVATTAVPATVAPTSELPPTMLPPTTLPPTTLPPTTLAPETTVAPEEVVQPEGGEAGSLPPGTPYTEYVLITDVSNLIEMRVPVEWSDSSGNGWEDDWGDDGVLESGPSLTASPDRQAWVDGWGTPGVFLGASLPTGWTHDELLDFSNYNWACTLDGRFDYEDGLYTGRFDSFSGCGDERSNFMNAYVQPADGTWIANLQIVMVTEADREAASTIVESFVIQPLGG